MNSIKPCHVIIYTLIVTCNLFQVEVLQATNNSEPAEHIQLMEVVANAGPDKAVTCVTNEVVIGTDTTSVGVNIIYEWTSANFTNISNPSSRMITVFEPDDYYLKVTDTSTSEMAFDTVVVTADFEEPMIDAIADGIISCNNPTVNLIASPIQSIYSYEWFGPAGFSSNMATTTTPIAGTYTLTVANTENGCSAQSSVNVLQNQDAPSANINPSSTLLSPGQTIQLNGSTTEPNATYLWSTTNGSPVNGATEQSIIINTVGVYCLTVMSSDTGCESEQVCVEVFAADAVIADAGADKFLTCNNTTAALGGQNSSMGTEYTYEWTDANGNIISSSAFVDVTIAGSYTLTVTNTQTGNTNTDNVEVISNEEIPMITIATASILTCENPTTLLDATTTIPGSYSYSWTTIEGNIVSNSFLEAITVDAAGEYILSVVDNNNGCSGSFTITIMSDINIPIATIAPPPSIVAGETVFLDGSASTTGPDISYMWSTSTGNIVSGGNTLNPSINSAGNYCLTIVNNSNGCESSTCVDVTEANGVVADAGETQILTCLVNTVTIGGSGSSVGANITYTWADQNGTIISNEPITNVSESGTYTLTVSDSDTGASNSGTVVVELNQEVPIISISNTGNIIDCNNLIVTLFAMTTKSNVAYNWTDVSNTTISTTSDVEVSEGGIYTVVVTNNSNGCSAVQEVSVEEDLEDCMPIALVTSPPPLTPGQTVTLDGSASSQGSNVQYRWSTDNGNIVAGASTAMAEVDRGGDYCLSVMNVDNGMESIACVKVTKLNIHFADAGADTEISCMGVAVTIGGHCTSTGAQYAYAWLDAAGTPLAITPFVDVEIPGVFTLTVTDTQNGETLSDQVSVEIATDMLSLSATTQDVSCFGLADGDVELNLSGGFEPFNYQGNGVSVEPNTLAAGPYAVTVTDAQDCTVVVDFVINEPAALTVNIIIQSGDTTLLADVLGGTKPYTYEWTVSQDSIVEVDLASQLNYEVTITDANGCTVTEDIMLEPNAIFDIISSPLYVYPNPTSGLVTIEQRYIQNDLNSIQVFDLLGKLVPHAHTYAGSDRMILDLAGNTSGSYIVVLNLAGKLYHQKINIF